MAPKLIAEEGLLKGQILDLDIGESWTIGRDEASCNLVLNDPSVSRKHVKVSIKDGLYVIENLSLINPILVDRRPIQGEVTLKDGNVVQIGSTWFRFTQTFDSSLDPSDEPEETLFEEKEPTPTVVDIAFPHARWMLKVIAGPNSGAEFFMEPGRTYLIGKDPSSCDILFQDRSVSNQHLSLTITDDDQVEIIDLESKNGAFVDGKPIDQKATIKPQETITLGTTTFASIDTKASSDTIVSEIPQQRQVEEKEPSKEKATFFSRILVPKRDLVIAGIFGVVVLAIGFSTLALFKTDKKDLRHHFGYESKIKEALAPFHDIEYSYDQAQQKLFLAGHVTSSTDSEQLNFNLEGLTFLSGVDNNVIVDELVWQEMNVILAKNPKWRSITLLAPSPGHFVVTGYLKTAQDLSELQDYLNLNFPLTEQLKNRVAVSEIIQGQVNKDLQVKGLFSVKSEYIDGELILEGSAPENKRRDFEKFLAQAKSIHGIRSIRNGVLIVTAATGDRSAIDLSSKYQITGNASVDGKKMNVIINGKLYFIGDNIDGMELTAIQSKEVLLQKDGLKYKIDYTLR